MEELIGVNRAGKHSGEHALEQRSTSAYRIHKPTPIPVKLTAIRIKAELESYIISQNQAIQSHYISHWTHGCISFFGAFGTITQHSVRAKFLVDIRMHYHFMSNTSSNMSIKHHSLRTWETAGPSRAVGVDCALNRRKNNNWLSSTALSNAS